MYAHCKSFFVKRKPIHKAIENDIICIQVKAMDLLTNAQRHEVANVNVNERQLATVFSSCHPHSFCSKMSSKPSESVHFFSDLNPIEHLWDQFERRFTAAAVTSWVVRRSSKFYGKSGTQYLNTGYNAWFAVRVDAVKPYWMQEEDIYAILRFATFNFHP